MPQSPIARPVPTPTPHEIDTQARAISSMHFSMNSVANAVRAQRQQTEARMKNAFRWAIFTYVAICIITTIAIYALMRMYSGKEVVVMLGLGAGLTLCVWTPYKLAASIFGILCENSEEAVHLE
ncbi:hypothetical protein LTR56_023996 [Elasticomyces elasticus]|nr:hypothetical protein LTR56_023996 [Elasticomyces elasticus]KAK3632193.1 hypothetical protein LTR22_020705 [Elasticomyces elasticus]KAK4906314.1 hypothetical protein LTR49_024512 [Elasticomyces elasticus]KAK5744298.1 hypothetical protein LTS12_023515 [Elasticomyces elasticus]